MSNNHSNFPAPAADRELNGTEWTSECVNSLLDLAQQGKPRDEQELERRIEEFFSYCAGSKVRPGIEALALSLGITRQTLWNWCSGISVPSERWQEICIKARQLILTFVEQSGLNGHISPPSFIFLLKNIGSYKDALSFEELVPADANNGRRTPEQIAAKHQISLDAAVEELPEATFIDGGYKNEE